MTPIFLMTSAVMMVAVLSLTLWSLQRRANQGMRSLGRAAHKLQALNEVGAAGYIHVSEKHHAALQAAIAKLADKLRQHPKDAEGWALLGRTYKAMRQYPPAREAFRNAMVAAPADADLAKEYANADTPSPER